MDSTPQESLELEKAKKAKILEIDGEAKPFKTFFDARNEDLLVVSQIILGIIQVSKWFNDYHENLKMVDATVYTATKEIFNGIDEELIELDEKLIELDDELKAINGKAQEMSALIQEQISSGQRHLENLVACINKVLTAENEEELEKMGFATYATFCNNCEGYDLEGLKKEWRDLNAHERVKYL